MDKEAMKRLPVESSNIKSIGHNFLTKNLEIEFKDGNIYRYKKVPRSVFRDIMGSESKGKYFFKNIRFDFPYRKYRNKDGDKIKSEWNKLHRKEDVDMSEKAASTILDELYKEAKVSPIVAGAAIGAAAGGPFGVLVRRKNYKKYGFKETEEERKKGERDCFVSAMKRGAAQGAFIGAGYELDKTYRKKASESLNEMFKEAIDLNPVGSMLGSGAAMKGIGKAFSQGKMGRTGWQATKAGLMNVSNQSGKIVAKAGLAAAGGHMLGNAVDNMTKPTEEDQYGRRVAASEKLDEMYKKAFVLGNTGTGALIGAGLGGVAGAIKGGMNNEKDENGKTHKVKSAIKSGLLGAGIGAAGGAAVGGAHGILKDSKALAQEQAKAVTNPKREFTLSKQKMTARTEKPDAKKRLGQRIHDLFHKPEGLKAKDKFDPVAEKNKATISNVLNKMPKQSCERLMEMVKEASLSPVGIAAIGGGAVGAVGGAVKGAGDVLANEKEKKGKLKKAFSAALKGGAVGGAAGAATGATGAAVNGALKKCNK